MGLTNVTRHKFNVIIRPMFDDIFSRTGLVHVFNQSASRTEKYQRLLAVLTADGQNLNATGVATIVDEAWTNWKQDLEEMAQSRYTQSHLKCMVNHVLVPVFNDADDIGRQIKALINTQVSHRPPTRRPGLHAVTLPACAAACPL